MKYWSFSGRYGWVVCERVESASPCPRCRSTLYLVRPRLIDRLFSFRRQRFQCESAACGWEGNLPVDTALRQLHRTRSTA